MTGGGVITWNTNSNNKLKWTVPFRLGPAPARVSTDGRILVTMPTSSTPNQNGVNQASADGVTLLVGEALWMTNPRGTNGTTSVAFAVIPYNHNLRETYFDSEDAFVIAWRSSLIGDDNIYLANGTIIEPGDRVISSGAASQGTFGSVGYKSAVRAATTSLLPAFTPTVDNVLTADVNGVLPNQDGVTLVVGDRFLVKNQTGAYSAYNGWYNVTSVGSVGSKWVLTRTADANTTEKFPIGSQSLITEGATQAGQVYKTNVHVTQLNSTLLSFEIWNPGGASSVPNASAAEKGITFLDTTPAVAGSPTAVGVNSPALAAFKQGLIPTWGTPANNGNTLTVSPGAAYIPSLGRVLNVPTTLTGPTMALAASTWYYVYLYDNGGTPTLDISTTAPVAYKSNARQMTGFMSRRHIHTFRTSASNVAYRTFRQGDWNYYLEDTGATPFRVLSAGAATTFTAVSCAAVVPPTSRLIAVMWHVIADSSYTHSWRMTGDAADSHSAGLYASERTLRLNTSQQFDYLKGGSAAPYVDLIGYLEEYA